MRLHRWWLALVAALLTPWVGPHMDGYLPVGWVVLRARSESPDAAFWVICALLLSFGYLLWLALLSGIAAWTARLRHPTDDS